MKEDFLKKYYDLILDISEPISDRMDELHLSKRKLAKKANVSHKFICRLLGDFPNKITIKQLLKIAIALDMQIDLTKIFIEK
jgi:transcriptional regulator with XRE-family HTH domain